MDMPPFPRFTPAELAAIVMRNSTPAAEFAGIKLASCDLLPKGLAMMGDPRHPERAVWISLHPNEESADKFTRDRVSPLPS